MAEFCPLCESGSLREVVVTEIIRYQDESLSVPGILVSRCDACREDIVLPAQIRANERVFSDAKRTRDGLLRAQEIVELRERLGVSQHAAASMFGGGANAFSKYERGEVLQSRSMDLLLRCATRYTEVANFLALRAGVELRDDGWETVPAQLATEYLMTRRDFPAAAVHVKRLAGSHNCANDGQWRDEPLEVAYGR